MMNLAAIVPSCRQAFSERFSLFRPMDISRADRQAVADALMQTLAKALQGLGLEGLSAGAGRHIDAQRFVQKMLCSDPGFARLYKQRRPAQAAAQAKRLIRLRGWTHAFLNEYLVNHAPSHLLEMPRRVVKPLARSVAVTESSFERAEKLFATLYADGTLQHIADTLGGTVARDIKAGHLRNGDALRMSHVLNGLGCTIPWTPGGTLQGRGCIKEKPRQYFYRVNDLVEHMRLKLGRPLRFAPPSNGACPELKGRKGIIFFRHNLSDLMGRVRLWNGEGIVGGACRFGSETEILFWPLDATEGSKTAKAGIPGRGLVPGDQFKRTDLPLLTRVADRGEKPLRAAFHGPATHAF